MENLWLALAVFLLRIINNALTTVRFIANARGQNTLSFVLAIIESLIFAFTVANVISDLTDPLMLAAYSVGFGIGSYLGLWIEKRFIQAFFTVNVITANGGHDIALALRGAGYGVTQTVGEGKDGPVNILRTTVDRRDSNRVIDIVRERSPSAFVSVEEARTIRHGHFRRPGNPR